MERNRIRMKKNINKNDEGLNEFITTTYKVKGQKKKMRVRKADLVRYEPGKPGVYKVIDAKLTTKGIKFGKDGMKVFYRMTNMPLKDNMPIAFYENETTPVLIMGGISGIETISRLLDTIHKDGYLLPDKFDNLIELSDELKEFVANVVRANVHCWDDLKPILGDLITKELELELKERFQPEYEEKPTSDEDCEFDGESSVVIGLDAMLNQIPSKSLYVYGKEIYFKLNNVTSYVVESCECTNIIGMTLRQVIRKNNPDTYRDIDMDKLFVRPIYIDIVSNESTREEPRIELQEVEEKSLFVYNNELFFKLNGTTSYLVKSSGVDQNAMTLRQIIRKNNPDTHQDIDSDKLQVSVPKYIDDVMLKRFDNDDCDIDEDDD